MLITAEEAYARSIGYVDDVTLEVSHVSEAIEQAANRRAHHIQIDRLSKAAEATFARAGFVIAYRGTAHTTLVEIRWAQP